MPSFQPGAQVYVISNGTYALNVEVPWISDRAPTQFDTKQGTFPIGKQWIDSLNNNAYVLTSYTSQTGQTLANWQQEGGASFSTTGNVTTSGGNLVASGTGSGLVLTPTIGATGATPRSVNGRVFTATFSGVSIAAGATQSLVIQNSSITGASTVVQYSMVGATSGAALTIQSVTNAAGQSTIVVQNGTGATTTTANITFTGVVLN